MNTPRILLIALSTALGLATFGQGKTKDGYSLSWDKEINTTTDTIVSDSLKVPAIGVPVYEARPSDVLSHLKVLLPGVEFKSMNGIYRAPGASMPAISPTPVDLLATLKEDKKAGFTLFNLGFVQNKAPLVSDMSAERTAMRDLGVKLNKAVVQEQVGQWEAQLTKAAKNTEDARADHDKANDKVSDASSDLQKITQKKSNVQRDIANNQADISRLDQRWQVSQNPKDLKKLTKMRETLAKNEKKLADLMADETKQQKTLNKRQDAVPDAAKDRSKIEDQQKEVQRTVDALKQKLDNIR